MYGAQPPGPYGGPPPGYGHPAGHNPYGAPQSSGPKKVGDNGPKIVAIVLAVVFGVMLLLGVVGYLTWKAFLKFGMGSDVDDYAAVVRSSRLDPDTETELLERLDRIEHQLRAGELRFSLFEWIELDEEVERLTGDGVVEPAEVPALRDALDAIEAG